MADETRETTDWFRDVTSFSLATGSAVAATPTIPPAEVAELRIRLIEEETRETIAAIRAGDLPGVADGAIDSIFVHLGTLLAYGVDARPCWDAVAAANLSKAGGPRRADGKILKSADWRPPDIAGILAAQPPIPELSGGAS